MTDSPEFNWKKQYTLQESAVSTILRDWLLHSGSFMQQLVERGAVDPCVHVLSQEWQYLERWENTLLQVAPDVKALVREVLIISKEKSWMFARSVFPQQTLTGEEAALANLQTRPLGSFLFNHPEMKRSEFSYACLHPTMTWHQKIRKHVQTIGRAEILTDLWSRYSLFYLQDKSLLLTEVFLPDIAELGTVDNEC